MKTGKQCPAFRVFSIKGETTMERTMKKSLKGQLGLMGLCTVMSLSAGLAQASSGPAYWLPSGAPQPSMPLDPNNLLNGITQMAAQQMMQQAGMGQLSSFMGPMGMQMGMANGLMGSALGANLDLTQMMQGMVAQVASQFIQQGVQKLMSSMTSGGGSGSQGSSGSSNLLPYDPNNPDIVNGTSSGLLGYTSTTPSFNNAMLSNQNLGSLLGTVVADATGGITGGTTNNASLGTGGLY
jgi:hypothetical protein